MTYDPEQDPKRDPSKLYCKFDGSECKFIDPQDPMFFYEICDVCVKHKIKREVSLVRLMK